MRGSRNKAIRGMAAALRSISDWNVPLNEWGSNGDKNYVRAVAREALQAYRDWEEGCQSGIEAHRTKAGERDRP